MSSWVTDMDWAKHYATAKGFRWWPNEELVRWVGDQHFGRVLEAGCGNGANLWFLSEHAELVVGVDREPMAVRAAKHYVATRVMHRAIEVYEGEVRALPFTGGTFDLLIDSQVSQHLPWLEHGPAYREYARVLGSNGWFWLCHADDGMDAEAMREPPWDWNVVRLFPSVELFCLPTPEALTKMVRDAGFASVERRRLARTYPDGQVASYTILAGRKL